MCPDFHTLSAFLDGEVKHPWFGIIKNHITQCSECGEKIQELKSLSEILKSDTEIDYEPAMERVRNRLFQDQKESLSHPPSFWKKRVLIPVPLAAFIALMIFCLTTSLAFVTTQYMINKDLRLMRITTQPSGEREVQVTASIDDLKQLLQSLEEQKPKQEVFFQLPEHSEFQVSGEPEFLREADFSESN